MLVCVNAAGYAIPPMVIYARSNLSQQLTRGEVPGIMYGLSPNSGWIDSELFTEWFERHFLLYAPAGRPILLMLDGHSSHYDPHFIRSAAEKEVIVFMLSPNTTHIAQPLDSTPFKCLNGCWDDECNTYMSENPGKVVTISSQSFLQQHGGKLLQAFVQLESFLLTMMQLKFLVLSNTLKQLHWQLLPKRMALTISHSSVLLPESLVHTLVHLLSLLMKKWISFKGGMKRNTTFQAT